MKKILEKRIKENIDIEVPLSSPPQWVDADFSTNVAFRIVKEEKRNVQEVADELIRELKKMYEFKDVYFLKPGFINFKISDDFIIEEFLKFSKDIDEYVRRNVKREKKRVLIECVSANPTGPLHIGHGRGGVIGDGLRGVFKFLGFDVSFEYYVNDRGKQIELLGESLKARYNGGNPPENGYKGDYLIKIAEKLKKEKREIDNWGEVAVNEILSIIKEELSIFGMKFDRFFHETELYKNGTVDEILNILNEKGLIYEKDNAKWFKAKEFGDTEDRVIIKSDGTPTYFLSDIAYHYDKLRRGYDVLINTWGADHHGYVKRLEAGIQALTGKKDILKVVLYQLVRVKRKGELVSMSTREGEFIELRKVIDEVGKDVARIYLLLKRYSTPLDFDLEEAKKKSMDNPVYYIQYAHARISSILRKRKERFGDFNYEFSKEKLKDVVIEKEIEIMKKLLFLPDLLSFVLDELDPYFIVDYLLSLSSLFHNYYNYERILENEWRIAFIEKIKDVIGKLLLILGIKPLEEM